MKDEGYTNQQSVRQEEAGAQSEGWTLQSVMTQVQEAFGNQQVTEALLGGAGGLSGLLRRQVREAAAGLVPRSLGNTDMLHAMEQNSEAAISSELMGDTLGEGDPRSGTEWEPGRDPVHNVQDQPGGSYEAGASTEASPTLGPLDSEFGSPTTDGAELVATDEDPLHDDLTAMLPDWAKPYGEAWSQTPANDPKAESQGTAAQHMAFGMTDVLSHAIELMDTSDAKHAYNVDKRGQGSKEIWSELKSGKIENLDAIMCHEFTAASLAAAGYNLDADYRDPKTGLRVAYADTSGYRIVEAWMVVGMFTEATEAILAAQNGETEHISPGSERADELKIQEADDILYSTTSTFTERKASSTHRFGAGAVAVAFGGDEIALDARKPGDVQQTLQVRDETYSGRGHSSIVHAVRGHGVAMLGAPGSPTLYGELDQSAPFAHPELELEPGWYRIDPGADIAWEVGPDTDPSTVASLTATHVQLIDANVKGSSMEGEGRRGDDATVLGDFDSKVARGDGKNGVETSTGRLPSSPWFGWATSEPESAIALSDQKPMTSP